MNVPKNQSETYEYRHFLGDRIISSDRIQLKVYNTINMEGNEDSHIGIEDESFSMSCFAKFDSEATEARITWFHNNLPIKDGQGQFNVMNTVIQSVTQKKVRSTLRIRRLNKKNEGIYVCEAVYDKPILNDIKTVDINLRVQFKPIFPENTQKNLWILDAPGPFIVNITCLVNADPVAEFLWFTGHGISVESSEASLYYFLY